MNRGEIHHLSNREPRRFPNPPTPTFERLAEAIVSRLAELLYAHVWMLDQDDVVVASSTPTTVGDRFNPTDHANPNAVLRIPLQLDGKPGVLIVGESLNSETISLRLVHALAQLVVSQVHEPDRTPQQYERKNAFIYSLLQGMLTDDATIMKEAAALELDLDTPRAVILISAADYVLKDNGQSQDAPDDAQIRRRAQLVIGSIVGFFHLPNDTICSYIGNGEIAVLKASNTRNLMMWASAKDTSEGSHSTWANLVALKRAGESLLAHLHSDISATVGIGIGLYHPGVHGIARSYQDARAALSLGRCCYGENRVHCVDGLGTAAFVGISEERTKMELAAHLLSPLDHEPELLETLKKFFVENCCPSSTARQLSIHRNTLAYRMQKITSLTGLDPRRFDEAAQMHLALLLRALDSRT
jgi:carbohydrate diacid regulator